MMSAAKIQREKAVRGAEVAQTRLFPDMPQSLTSTVWSGGLSQVLIWKPHSALLTLHHHHLF